MSQVWVSYCLICEDWNFDGWRKWQLNKQCLAFRVAKWTQGERSHGLVAGNLNNWFKLALVCSTFKTSCGVVTANRTPGHTKTVSTKWQNNWICLIKWTKPCTQREGTKIQTATPKVTQSDGWFTKCTISLNQHVSSLTWTVRNPVSNDIFLINQEAAKDTFYPSLRKCWVLLVDLSLC